MKMNTFDWFLAGMFVAGQIDYHLIGRPSLFYVLLNSGVVPAVCATSVAVYLVVKMFFFCIPTKSNSD